MLSFGWDFFWVHATNLSWNVDDRLGSVKLNHIHSLKQTACTCEASSIITKGYSNTNHAIFQPTFFNLLQDVSFKERWNYNCKKQHGNSQLPLASKAWSLWAIHQPLLGIPTSATVLNSATQCTGNLPLCWFSVLLSRLLGVVAGGAGYQPSAEVLEQSYEKKTCIWSRRCLGLRNPVESVNSKFATPLMRK